jgi:hypothetical protein
VAKSEECGENNDRDHRMNPAKERLEGIPRYKQLLEEGGYR